MELDELWKIGLGTILSLIVLVGMFRFKNALRQRLFPPSKGKARGEAMAELMMLQARLQEEVEDSTTTKDGEGDGVVDFGAGLDR